MRTLFVLALTACLVSTLSAQDKPAKKLKKDDWQPMFDGTTLDGWKANEHPESWTVKDGAIRGDGPAQPSLLHGGALRQLRIQGRSTHQSRRQFGHVFPHGVRPGISQRL